MGWGPVTVRALLRAPDGPGGPALRAGGAGSGEPCGESGHKTGLRAGPRIAGVLGPYGGGTVPLLALLEQHASDTHRAQGSGQGHSHRHRHHLTFMPMADPAFRSRRYE